MVPKWLPARVLLYMFVFRGYHQPGFIADSGFGMTVMLTCTSSLRPSLFCSSCLYLFELVCLLLSALPFSWRYQIK